MDILELGPGAPADAVDALEGGGLVLLRQRPFDLSEAERRFLDPAILTRSKNVSFDPATESLGGVSAEHPATEGPGQEVLRAMMRRFSDTARALLDEVAPTYRAALQMRRTSFRPGAVAVRALSPRKDDRRLHVDAFPANPVQGRRILRVFANVNPSGEDRMWEVGDDSFEQFARRYAPRLRSRAGGAWLRERLGLTKGRRTDYDQAMLSLHDLGKLDDGYQAQAPRRRMAFPSGAMWAVFTDGVLHAALGGQHAFEQTFLLPPAAMRTEDRSPLRILERVTGRALV